MHLPMPITTGACNSIVIPWLTFAIVAGSWILYSSIVLFVKSKLLVTTAEGGPMILT
jgi:hypothetical protein